MIIYFLFKALKTQDSLSTNTRLRMRNHVFLHCYQSHILRVFVFMKKEKKNNYVFLEKNLILFLFLGTVMIDSQCKKKKG